MFRMVVRTLFWSALAFCFVMAVTPQPVALPTSDKTQHVVAFATLAVLAVAGYRDAGLLRLWLGLVAFGGAIELVQGLAWIGRTADPLDWLADIGAASVVIGAAALWPAPRSAAA